MSERFTPDEVEALFEHQLRRQFHPFTCPNRGDGNHRRIGSDKGMLVPTVRGWICPFCDYTQDWAHDSMKVKRPAVDWRGRPKGIDPPAEGEQAESPNAR